MAAFLSTSRNRRLLTAAAVASLQVIEVGSFHAMEQQSSNSNSAPVSEGSAPLSRGTNNLDAVFAARWTGPEIEFALGGNGKIRLSDSSLGGGRRDRARPPGYTGSQIDSLAEPDAFAEPQPCGPSPFSADETALLVTAAAEKHGVNPDFALAVATVESRLDRFRNSPKGARGPMQLMPATAERFGVDDICDPVANIDGGVRFLRELVDAYKNPMLVAAAYNAGEGSVREHGGVPPFLETVSFVAKVLNHQLGLPERQPGRETTGSWPSVKTAAPEAGVITTKDRRQWVGGVMHF